MRHSASRTMLTHARTCAGKQLTRALARASSSHAICDASSERTRREECLGGAIGVGGAQARGLPTTRSASTRAHARDALCSGDAFARARGRGVSARGFASATTGEEGASAAATMAETCQKIATARRRRRRVEKTHKDGRLGLKIKDVRLDAIRGRMRDF